MPNGHCTTDASILARWGKYEFEENKKKVGPINSVGCVEKYSLGLECVGEGIAQ